METLIKKYGLYLDELCGYIRSIQRAESQNEPKFISNIKRLNNILDQMEDADFSRILEKDKKYLLKKYTKLNNLLNHLKMTCENFINPKVSQKIEF